MRLVALWFSMWFAGVALADEPVWQPLAHAPAPADNPLKGLVPYAGAANPDRFPHSMEFSYFPLNAVLKGPGRYDWSTLERFLDAVAGRGHQAIFRFYLEYPGKPAGLPAHLQEAGVALTRWERAQARPDRAAEFVDTPDYRHPALRAALVDFIGELGRRYDGDPRIGYLTAGLLGLWGEWHDYPKQERFADKSLQAAVMDAYAAAFRLTPILLRYPAGETDPDYVANAATAFGFHDDSFAWNTLPTKPHYFVAKLQAAGATEAWKTRPVGGEIRPEAWGKVFDAEPGPPMLQDFAQCVAATHVTWLMDSGMFKTGNPAPRRARAIEQVRGMGYEFHVPRVAFAQAGERMTVRFEIENRGVAPFYQAWPLKLALLDASGRKQRETSARPLTGILPQSPSTAVEQAIDLTGLPAGAYHVLLQGANPLPAGQPVRFANAAQDADLPGWLTLGTIHH